MILCVDKKAIPTSPKVQKDVNLEDIINNDTKYYDSVEEALKDDFVPLDFSVSLRSIYSNYVLQIGSGDSRRFYTNLTEIQPFVHKGYDLIMYLTSIGLMHNIDYKSGFDDLMMRHSQFQPIGIYNPDPTVINPIIYSHILISDEAVDSIQEYLKEDRCLISIGDMNYKFRDGNIPALLDTLIEIKCEDKMTVNEGGM